MKRVNQNINVNYKTYIEHTTCTYLYKHVTRLKGSHFKQILTTYENTLIYKRL